MDMTPSFGARRSLAEELGPPHDDASNMAGQGAIGLETMDHPADLAGLTVYVPIDGDWLRVKVFQKENKAYTKHKIFLYIRVYLNILGGRNHMANIDGFDRVWTNLQCG